MSMRFIVLASGSSGNANYLETDELGLLIDFGLGPKRLETDLAKINKSWQDIQAVLLTHTHSDHWNENTLAYLRTYSIPLYCHPNHSQSLHSSSNFRQLCDEGLVFDYELGKPLSLARHLSCWPFPVRHDSGVTCGFRVEGPRDVFGQAVVLGYASDLGSWDQELVQKLANVDVLALEFNHDVVLQKTSSRSRKTIARNLGHAGHLSNDQAAALVCEILAQSEKDRLQHIVQLHLSAECNFPALAQGALQKMVEDSGHRLQVHTTHANKPGPRLSIGGLDDFLPRTRKKFRRSRINGESVSQAVFQPFLPGFEG